MFTVVLLLGVTYFDGSTESSLMRMLPLFSVMPKQSVNVPPEEQPSACPSASIAPSRAVSPLSMAIFIREGRALAIEGIPEKCVVVLLLQ